MTAMKVTVHSRQVATGRGYRIVRRAQVHQEKTLWQRLVSLWSQTPEIIFTRQQRLKEIESEQGRYFRNAAGQVIHLPEQGRGWR